MTNEERQKLCEALRSSPDDPIEIIAWMRMAANEIERLADRVNALEHIINLDMYEATKNALVQAQDEIERLAALAQSNAEPETYGDQLRRVMKRQAMQFDTLLREHQDPSKWVSKEAMERAHAQPSIDEDAVDAAFDKWAGTRGYGRMENRLSFHAGVEFGLRQYED